MNIAYKKIISRKKFGKRYDPTGNFFYGCLIALMGGGRRDVR